MVGEQLPGCTLKTESNCWLQNIKEIGYRTRRYNRKKLTTLEYNEFDIENYAANKRISKQLYKFIRLYV